MESIESDTGYSKLFYTKLIQKNVNVKSCRGERSFKNPVTFSK